MTSWMELFFFAWSVISAAILWWWLFRWSRFADHFRLAVWRPWPWGAIDIIVVYLLMALFSGGAVTLLAGQPAGFVSIGRFLAELAAIVAIAGYLVARYSKHALPPTVEPKAQKNAATSLPSQLLFGLLVGIVAIPLVLRIQIAGSVLIQSYSHPTLEGLKEQQSSLVAWGLALKAIVTAPIVEEIFYRLILQGWLQRLDPTQPVKLESLILGRNPRSNEPANKNQPTAPPWWPVFVSAFVFAGAHIGLGASPIPLFFFGLVLGYLFRRSGSILPCILVHAMLNTYSIVLVLMA